MRGDPGGRKQNSTVAVRGAGDDGADRVAVAMAGGAVAAPTAHTANAGAAAQPLDLAHPTKALCKKASYKIGYDVFSGSQPFAVSLTDGLINAA